MLQIKKNKKIPAALSRIKFYHSCESYLNVEMENKNVSNGTVIKISGDWFESSNEFSLAHSVKAEIHMEAGKDA